MKFSIIAAILTFAVASNLGHARMLLQTNLESSESSDIPMASNTSLAVPIYRYLLGSPAPAPSRFADLSNALAPALAPVSFISEGIQAIGRRLREQARMQTSSPAPSPAPVPAPEAACRPVAALLPPSFASLGQTLGLAATLASLPNTNFTLVVPSDDALSGSTERLATLAADPTALQQIISQGLIIGKDLRLQNGDVLTTRLSDSPITVTEDAQGMVMLKTAVNSATVLAVEKSCTVDLLLVDAVLLPSTMATNALG